VLRRQRPDAVLQVLTQPRGRLGGRTHGLGDCGERRRARLARTPALPQAQEGLDEIGASVLATGLGQLDDDLPGVSSEFERLREQVGLPLEIVMDQRGIDARRPGDAPQTQLVAFFDERRSGGGQDLRPRGRACLVCGLRAPLGSPRWGKCSDRGDC
jgi:hypothetical protein